MTQDTQPTQAERNRANQAARRARLQADPTLAPHGRVSTYGAWGCRCQPCRDAWNADIRARRSGVRKGPHRGYPAEVRFWRKVAKGDSCWLWTGKPSAYGYGSLAGDDGRRVSAHRFSYELHNGPIPNGLLVDHTCYNRMCVNPAHLRAVTHTANMHNRAGASRVSQSGVRGVYPADGQWRVQVTARHERFSAGPFDTIEEAEAVAVAMRRILMPDSLRDRE